MDIQKLLDTMSEISQRERSTYHVTLGEMIEAPANSDAEKPIVISDAQGQGVEGVDSYRGYYSDLALEPTNEPTTVGKLLKTCKFALGQPFQGYKGGYYVMTEQTPLWVSEYGHNSGRAIVATTDTPEAFILTIKAT